MDDVTLERLADLAIGFGCNLREGQILAISGEPGKERLVRALAESAYKRGAKFVDVGWFDPWVKRARIEHAAEDTLDFVPPWIGERVLALGDSRAARVALSGPVAPGLLEDLDPVRAGPRQARRADRPRAAARRGGPDRRLARALRRAGPRRRDADGGLLRRPAL